MNFTVIPVAATALVLGLDTATAQSRANTLASFAGNSEIGVLNVASATANVGSYPSAELELRSEGWFLGYRGSFYSATTTAQKSAWWDAGSWALRVGTQTVRSSLFLGGYAAPSGWAYMEVPGSRRTATYNVGGLAIAVDGYVVAGLDIDEEYTFSMDRVKIDGRMTARASGVANTRLVMPIPALGSRGSHSALWFGRQIFDGDVNVGRVGVSTKLDYTMEPIELYLRICLTFLGLDLSCRTVIDAVHQGVHLWHFL